VALMQPNSRKLAALLKHTKLMPPPVKQRREGTMGKKLMVCLEGKKVETKKKLSKKNNISMKLVWNNLKEQKRL